jgi:hypothetical protein
MERKRLGSWEQIEWKATFKEGKERSMPKCGKKAKTRKESTEERRVSFSFDGWGGDRSLGSPSSYILYVTTMGEIDTEAVCEGFIV